MVAYHDSDSCYSCGHTGKNITPLVTNTSIYTCPACEANWGTNFA